MPEGKVISVNFAPNSADGWSVFLENVTFDSRSRSIIYRIDCRLSARGISVIMGENGAGKSILLKTIAGLLKPTTGHVQLHPDIAGRTAMVFQQPVLLRRSATANLNHALRIARVNRVERRRRIAALLDICGLTAFADQPARKLSGGEQQRLQLARALASKPKLLLMDEPTANLDPRSSLALEELIRITSKSGVKVVLVTHNLGQAKRLAEEVLFLNHGTLAEIGSSHDLFAHPKSSAFKAYLEGKLVS